jgi:hypothetical protein
MNLVNMNLSKKNNSKTLLAMIFLVTGLLSDADHAQATGTVHDKEYWRAIIADDFAPPAEVPIASLVNELSGYLSSTDPDLRDGIAYSILTQWLYVKKVVPPDLRRDLIDNWTANLRQGIGESDTDSVLKRSFSALMLSVTAALDNEAPYLERQEFDSLLQAALRYLHDEQDTRGFEPTQGWLHSVAHTADLLKFLGRSRHLSVSEQTAVLNAISDKMSRVDHVLVHGEDERLARVVLSIAARPDVDMQALQVFLAVLKPVRSAEGPSLQSLAANQNRKNLAVSLFALLNTDSRDFESLRTTREEVLGLLRTMM